MSFDPSLPAKTSPAPADPANSNQLRLINTSLSGDGRHVCVHFVATGNAVTTVMLSADVAARFHASLGRSLQVMRSAHPSTLRLN